MCQCVHGVAYRESTTRKKQAVRRVGKRVGLLPTRRLAVLPVLLQTLGDCLHGLRHKRRVLRPMELPSDQRMGS